MGDKLIMSKKERLRKTIFDRVKDGQLSQVDASRRLGLSYRQTKRSYQRFLKEGDAGLVHRSRGKGSHRAYAPAKKANILKHYEEKYMGFGPTLASEKLEEDDGYQVNRETLRLWLKAAGLYLPRRKRKAHRQRRQRRSRFGDLLQMDGSIHPWFEGVNQNQCLMNIVDDATGKTLALLDSGETTYAALALLKWWIDLHGIPAAVYVDLKSLYISPKALGDDDNDEEVEPEWLTHFSKACKRLGIEVIKAYSPQAKGRVERNHAVYQDRFVKELKLKGIKTIEEANSLLKDGFIDKLNEKFAKAPASQEDAHVPLEKGQDLNQLLCWDYTRCVMNDWVVRFENQHYQLQATTKLLVSPRQKITVRRHLDGSITLWAKEEKLGYQLVDKKPKVVNSKAPLGSEERSAIARANKKNSPWSQYNPTWLKKTKSRECVAV